MIIATAVGVNASEDVNAKSGFAVDFNGEVTGYESVIYNEDITYEDVDVNEFK